MKKILLLLLAIVSGCAMQKKSNYQYKFNTKFFKTYSHVTCDNYRNFLDNYWTGMNENTYPNISKMLINDGVELGYWAVNDKGLIVINFSGPYKVLMDNVIEKYPELYEYYSEIFTYNDFTPNANLFLYRNLHLFHCEDSDIREIIAVHLTFLCAGYP